MIAVFQDCNSATMAQWQDFTNIYHTTSAQREKGGYVVAYVGSNFNLKFCVTKFNFCVATKAYFLGALWYFSNQKRK